jgi:DNA-damage-inducible protein J
VVPYKGNEEIRVQMSKTGYLTARVEPGLKASAGKVLSRVGISTSDAITMFLKQVVLHGGLPFEVRIPNAATKKALQELERGGGESFGTSTKEAFRQAMAVRKKRRV